VKRLRKRIISLVAVIVVFVIGNFICNNLITDKGLEQSAAAFAGNKDIDVVDALTSNSLINTIMTAFNIILGILFLYSCVRLIITIVALVKEQRNLNKIIKEEL
jgi:hypothetical protein